MDVVVSLTGCDFFCLWWRQVVNTLVRKWVESVQSQGTVSPALLDSGMDQKECYWFVVENEGKIVSVRVRDTQGFWSNLVDRFRELFSKRWLQSQIVEDVEAVGEIQP